MTLTVSVVIPVYDDPHLVASLAAVISQRGVASFEVLVVDNAPTPRLADLVTATIDQALLPMPSVHYVHEPNRGSYRARNRGWRQAQGRFVVFLDAKCRPYPGWLAALVAKFSDAAVGGVAGAIEKQPGLGWVAQAQREFLLDPGLQYLTPIFPLPYAPTGNIAYRRQILDQLGGFDESFALSGGDVDFAWRVQLAGYHLVFAPAARVALAVRTNLAAYFQQFYKYGQGHALLAKKYMPLTGRRLIYNPYPVQGIGRALVRLPAGLLRLLIGGTSGPCQTHVLELVECAALLCGSLHGAVKHRVWFI